MAAGAFSRKAGSTMEGPGLRASAGDDHVDMTESFVADDIAYLLARAAYMAAKSFNAQLRPFGVGPAEWRVLSCLAEGHPMAIGVLAELVLQKQPTLTKIVDRMEADGLVSRTEDVGDRRRVLVAITPKGRGIVSDLIAKARAHEGRILGDYGPAQQARLKSALKTLILRCEG